MKIAAFYSDSPFASWGQAEGFCDVLKRMGHDVVGIGVPPVTKVTQELADKVNKPIDDCDMVIVSGPEHLRAWIRAFYPNWAKLKMPKVGWYHESFVREDYTLDYANFEGMFDFHFFPDRNDAEKYHGEFLPLGVDTHMFRRFEDHDQKLANWCQNLPDEQIFTIPRDIEVGFIGLMYPKRARFVEELTPHLGDIKIKYMVGCQSERGLIPAIAVWDADGLNVRRSMQLLAGTYRRIKVFVALPNICNALMSKVLEAIACGCYVIAPKQPVQLHCLSEYKGAYSCAEEIRWALANPDRIESRLQLSALVRHEHSMESRFEQIFSKVGVCVSS